MPRKTVVCFAILIMLTEVLALVSNVHFARADGNGPSTTQDSQEYAHNSAGYDLKIIERRMTSLELQALKNQTGVREKAENYNQIVSGHGTGLSPPSEKEWRKIEEQAYVVDRVYSATMPQPPQTVDNTASPWFPPIGDQGSQGSCVAFAVGYYMKTFQEAKEHGWALSGSTTDKIISPSFLYNLINYGVDQGSYYSEAIQLVCSVGACSLAKKPYNAGDYTSWPSEEAWREATLYRANYSGINYMSLQDDAGLANLKNWLTSGNLAILSVDAHKIADSFWGWSLLDGNDMLTLDNYVNPSTNHAGTIVGYNDNFAYTEEGQTHYGAFKIANSWGIPLLPSPFGWEHILDGCYWISYEAMKQRVEYCMFYDDIVGYTPELVATFRVNHNKRDECDITVGAGNVSNPIVTKRFSDYVHGGNAPFCQNDILFDITEFKNVLAKIYDQQYFLRLYDGGSITVGTLAKFAVNNTQSMDTPLATVNYDYVVAYVTLTTPMPFEDGFEVGSFNAWSGTNISSGETATVQSTTRHHGNYAARLTSNGGGGTEYSYCYKNIVSSSEAYARGYFYVSQTTLPQDGSRFFFIIFTAGSNQLAFAGWRRIGGAVKWTLATRNGTKYMDVFSLASLSKSRWYCVELHWKGDSVNGLAEMYVDGKLVCSSYGINTSAFGSVSQVQVGLGQIMYCGTTTVYCDCAKIGTAYIGPEPATSTLTVTSPNGGESWVRGTTHPITWTWTGSVGTYVKIEVLKGGVVKGSLTTANDGSYSWTIGSSHVGSDYKIRITSTSNPSITDSSDSNFAITTGAAGTLKVTSPNGGESWKRGTTHAITWTSSGSVGANVKIELLKGGVVKGSLTTANDGSYSWTIGMSHLGGDYKVRITSTSNPAIIDVSDNDFAITT